MKNTNIKLINPLELDSIKNLRKSEIAFPEIEYDGGKLNRKKTTIKSAFTNIRKNIDDEFITDLINLWNDKGGIKWQNDMLDYLEKEIMKMIDDYRNNPTSFKLKKIFIYIQLWGGNTSRGFVLEKNGGFINNFNESKYISAINEVYNNPLKALESLLCLKQMGISFATKHIYFWSKMKLPIYDNIIAMIVFGRLPQNKINHYNEYIEGLQILSKNLNTKSNILERSLFNWFESRDGKIWFYIRKTYLEK